MDSKRRAEFVHFSGKVPEDCDREVFNRYHDEHKRVHLTNGIQLLKPIDAVANQLYTAHGGELWEILTHRNDVGFLASMLLSCLSAAAGLLPKQALNSVWSTTTPPNDSSNEREKEPENAPPSQASAQCALSFLPTLECGVELLARDPLTDSDTWLPWLKSNHDKLIRCFGIKDRAKRKDDSEWDRRKVVLDLLSKICKLHLKSLRAPKRSVPTLGQRGASHIVFRRMIGKPKCNFWFPACVPVTICI